MGTQNEYLTKIFQDPELLNKFKDGEQFDFYKNNKQPSLIETAEETFDLDSQISIPVYCINKKQFIAELPKEEISRNIYGDIVNDQNEAVGFSTKMALITLYASISNFKNKFIDSKENIESILKHKQPLEVTEQQYIMLKKLESSFGLPIGNLDKFFKNAQVVEQQLKDKYSLAQLSEILASNKFIVRTSKYQKKHKNEETADMFVDDEHLDENTINESIVTDNVSLPELMGQIESATINSKEMVNKIEEMYIKQETSQSTLQKWIDVVKHYQNQYIQTQDVYHLKLLFLSIDKLLNTDNTLDVERVFEDIEKPENKHKQEIAALRSVIENKHHGEVISFDDIQANYMIVQANMLLDNNHSNIKLMNTVKTHKKLETIYQAYTETSPVFSETGYSSVLYDYLAGDKVVEDFDNSFSKTINSKVVSYHLGEICKHIQNQEDVAIIVEQIKNAKFDNSYQTDELKKVFQVQNSPMAEVFLDEIRNELPAIIQQDQEVGKFTIKNMMETALSENNVEQVNEIMNFVKTELVTDSTLDKGFVAEMYHMALKEIGNKSELADLSITQEDVQKYGLSIAKKQSQKISSLKP